MLRSRAVWFLGTLLLLSAFGWCSVQVYLSKTDAEQFRAWEGPYSWVVGPPPDALEEAAERRVRTALDRLNDRSLPANDRVKAYREELRRAEALLVRSLRAQPAQARVLAQLAAVRWELDPPRDDAEVRTHLEMIALASAMAPTVPGIQVQLGELLLKMGRRDEATAYLSRTVELNAEFIPQVVTMMRDNLFSAEEILSALPAGPDLLAELQQPFLEDGGESRYVEAVEALLAVEPGRATAPLLQAYGTACLDLDQAGRLRERMEEMGPLEQAELEAARWHQMARASLALGEPRRAVEEARKGALSIPDSPAQATRLGDLALQAGEAGVAIEAYRGALGLVARGSGNALARAGYYERIGRAEERLGRPDRAYDNYKRALRLDPSREHARRRVEEMEAAAGLGRGGR